MAAIPLLSGIYTTTTPDFRTAYPVNMVPVPMATGISEAYLRPGDGIVADGTGPGVDRGGIEWNGLVYRVMGTKLVRIDAAGSRLAALAKSLAGTRKSRARSFAPSNFAA